MADKIKFVLPGTTTSDLRGKQSVRATFKLSKRTIDAMSIISTHLGIKLKSLIDHLMGDIESLNVIADGLEQPIIARRDCIQKTYVLSRQTLSVLDEVSRNFEASRDSIVEYSVQRLIPVIAKEQERHKKRKEIYREILTHYMYGEKLLEKAESELGAEDPVFSDFDSAVSGYGKIVRNIKQFIERGDIIESF